MFVGTVFEGLPAEQRQAVLNLNGSLLTRLHEMEVALSAEGKAAGLENDLIAETLGWLQVAINDAQRLNVYLESEAR